MKKKLILLFAFAQIVLFSFSCKKEQVNTQPLSAGTETDNLSINANGDTISLFKDIPVYGIYRYPVVQDTLPPGIVRLSNPAVAKFINITPILKNYKKGMQLLLTLYGQEDYYDRLAYIYFSDKKPVADGPDQSIKTNSGIEAMRFITPFFSNTSNPNKKIFVSDVTDITDIIPYLNKDVWVAVQIDNNPEYRVSGKAGFTFSLDIVKTSTAPSSSYVQNLFKTSMYQKNYADTFVTDKALTNARISFTTSAHGSATGGEEYAHRKHYIYIDGVLASTIDTKKDCGPYRQFSPLGNPGIFIGNNTFNPRNWCPGEVLPHYSIYLGNLAKGQHIIRVEVPDADFGSAGDNIIVSGYLTGN